MITRRDFLCGSATILASVRTLKASHTFGQQKFSPNTDYSLVIERIKQMLPAAMALKDVTGASIALVDGENIVWSEGMNETPPVLLDASALRRFEGTYLLYEGILVRFKYEKGNLFHVVGNEKLQLDARSSSEFTQGSRRYRFLLSENGKPKGVQIFDSYYDPQTTENSVTYLPVNDAPADARGLNKPEWSQHVGRFAGTFLGGSSEVKVSLEQGYLYLNGELRLRELRTGFFITADGDAVIFKDEGLSIGNKLFKRK